MKAECLISISVCTSLSFSDKTENSEQRQSVQGHNTKVGDLKRALCDC